MSVRFTDVPRGWRIATALTGDGDGFTAENYDRLVDGPVEIGNFDESDFEAAGGRYRIVVDAERGDYDMHKVGDMVRRIVLAGYEGVKGRPVQRYHFFFHFT